VTDANTAARPIVSVRIVPKTDDDRQRLRRVMSDLAQRDPTIRVETDSADGQITIRSTGELQLEKICDSLVHEYTIRIEISKPEVIYLETIRQGSEAEGKYMRGLSRRTLYGHVKLRLEPLPAGSGYQFIDESSESAVPREFVDPINEGILLGMKAGILAGYEMTDVRAVLYDGSHAEEPNEIAYKIAASMAFKEAARKASPVILEPVMSVEVVTPEDFAGAIMGDLSSRRGRLESVEPNADAVAVRAVAPMAEMLGYAKHLRSATQGRSSYSMQFLRYEPAPHSDSGADEIGMTAKKPNSPVRKSGSAAANADDESD
jgi:elongation factor G